MTRQYTKHNYVQDLQDRQIAEGSLLKKIDELLTLQSKTYSVGAGMSDIQTRTNGALRKINKNDADLWASVAPLYDEISDFLQKVIQNQQERNKLLGSFSTTNWGEIRAALVRDMENVSEFFKAKKLQIERRSDIQAFVGHLQKQLEKEQKRADVSHSGIMQFFLEKLVGPRKTKLQRLLQSEKQALLDIDSTLQSGAKDVYYNLISDDYLSSLYQLHADVCGTLTKKLTQCNVAATFVQHDLSQKLQIFQTRVDQVHPSKHVNKISADKGTSVLSSKQQIQLAFQEAFDQRQAIVLKGTHRSIGFTYSTIKAICDDALYKDDILNSVETLLETPKKALLADFKHVEARSDLRELSVTPKSGKCASMPRLYLTEVCLCERDGDAFLVASNRQKFEGQPLWLAVKKGTKTSQGADIAITPRSVQTMSCRVVHITPSATPTLVQAQLALGEYDL